MSRARPGLVSELVPVFLIVLAVGGSLGLVIAMHERAATDARPLPTVATAPPPPKPEPTPAVAVVAPPPAPKYETKPIPKPKPKPKPNPPVQDPTKPILAALAAEGAKERDFAREADRTAAAFESARRSAAAESERWRRREALAREQVNKLADQAGTIEAQVDGLAAAIDALARHKEAAKTDLAQSVARGGGYAVLPHKGPHGTWQRPVMIECREGMAILQPRNIGFTLSDMDAPVGLRGSPLVASVARELMKVQRTTSPDGDPVVPYIYFIIRPDGIRSYYEARGQLERLGIAFGYELVERDWRIEFPDFDSLASWDGLKPLRPPLPDLALETAPGSGGNGASGPKGNEFVWPVDRPVTGARGNGNANGGTGAGGGPGDSDSGSPFLWPTQPPGGLAGGPPGNDGASGMADAESSTPGSAGGPGGLGIGSASGMVGIGSSTPGGPGGAVFAPRYAGGTPSGTGGRGGDIDVGSLTPPAPGVDMGGNGRTPTLPQMLGDPRRRGMAPLGGGSSATGMAGGDGGQGGGSGFGGTGAESSTSGYPGGAGNRGVSPQPPLSAGVGGSAFGGTGTESSTSRSAGGAGSQGIGSAPAMAGGAGGQGVPTQPPSGGGSPFLIPVDPASFRD